MIEPRRGQRTRSQFFRIQSKKFDWILRALRKNTQEESTHCPILAEGLGFDAFLAISKKSPLCELRGEKSLALILLELIRPTFCIELQVFKN